MLITRFPNEKFPNRDKTIKRKLWQGLPKMSKERLEGFLEDGYPLQKFIDRLEHERLYLEASNGPNVWRIPEQKESMETIPSPPSPVSTVSQEEIEDLRKQVRELKASLSTRRPPMTKPPVKYNCPYCQKSNHSLRECWRAPPPGHCFDCRRPNCRRGSANCPGRSNLTPKKPDTSPQQTTQSTPQA